VATSAEISLFMDIPLKILKFGYSRKMRRQLP